MGLTHTDLYNYPISQSKNNIVVFSNTMVYTLKERCIVLNMLHDMTKFINFSPLFINNYVMTWS